MHTFYFSSRRRHTRWPRDWSSDVCSSDLREQQTLRAIVPIAAGDSEALSPIRTAFCHRTPIYYRYCVEYRFTVAIDSRTRSEERRVGKECRCQAAREYEEKDAGGRHGRQW